MDQPLYHLPYSTNWFLPNIVAISPDRNHFSFGSNNQVHTIHMPSHSPLPSLTFTSRIQAIQYAPKLQIATQIDLNIDDQRLPIKDIFMLDGEYIITQNKVFKNQEEILQFQGKVKWFKNEVLVLEDKMIWIKQNIEQKISKILWADCYKGDWILLLKDKGKFWIKIGKDTNWQKEFEVSFKSSLAEKPSFCLMLFEKDFILSGTKGELYIISRENQDKILLDEQNLNTFYGGEGEFSLNKNSFTILQDNPHNKPIYNLYRISEDDFVALGQDRKLSFWKNNKRYYSLDLLQTKHTQVNTYDNQILALSSLNSIRKWVIKPRDKYYSYEINQQLNNLNIKQFQIHPDQDGFIGIITEDQLGIYNLYEQKLITLSQSLENLEKVFWSDQLPQDLIDMPYQAYAQNQLSLPKNLYLVALSQSKIYFFKQNELKYYNIPYPENFEPHATYFDEKTGLLMLGSKHSDILLIHLSTNKRVAHKLNQSSMISSISYGFPYLFAANMGREIYIAQLFLDDMSLFEIRSFKYKCPIIKSKWNQDQVLGIGYRSNGIQIWDSEGQESKHIRGHDGWILDANWWEDKVVTSSEDQSLKIWDLDQIQSKKPSNKKKKKVKLENDKCLQLNKEDQNQIDFQE